VPAIRGEHVAAIAVTEPAAGSDVAGIRPRAVRDGDHWVINGSKMYITNAATADWLCLLAVTDPDAGYGGFTQIIVPTDSRGLHLPAPRQDREQGLGHGLLFFDDVRVPVANTIGDPNRGFQQQMMQFQDERMVVVVTAPVTAGASGTRRSRTARSGMLFGKAAREDAGDAAQARRSDDPDHRGAGVLLPLHPEDGARRGRDARHLDGEGLLHHDVAARRDLVHAALRRRRLLLGEPRRARFVDSRLAAIGGGADEVMKQVIAKMLQI
jgi:citronellyl-CoA dehydrogenase